MAGRWPRPSSARSPETSSHFRFSCCSASTWLLERPERLDSTHRNPLEDLPNPPKELRAPTFGGASARPPQPCLPGSYNARPQSLGPTCRSAASSSSRPISSIHLSPNGTSTWPRTCARAARHTGRLLRAQGRLRFGGFQNHLPSAAVRSHVGLLRCCPGHQHLLLQQRHRLTPGQALAHLPKRKMDPMRSRPRQSARGPTPPGTGGKRSRM